MVHVLQREQVIPRSRDVVFAFFADPTNLERITPPSLHFQIRGSLAEAVRAGTVIDYRIALLGVPFSWRTLIEEVDWGRRFVDVQLKGPYRTWRHQHDFSDLPHGTLMRDRVDYQLPLGLIGELGGLRLVRRQLEGIFDFRRNTLARLFPPEANPAAK